MFNLTDSSIVYSIFSNFNKSGLVALMESDHATSGLTEAIEIAVHSEWITGFFRFFTSICMITAFLGVSLGLFDFLADGLALKKAGYQGHGILLLTFLPPLIVVLINPSVYLHALSYAGVCCVILLLLMPAIMAWRGRSKNMPGDTILVPGGNLVLALILFVSLILLLIALKS